MTWTWLMAPRGVGLQIQVRASIYRSSSSTGGVSTTAAARTTRRTMKSMLMALRMQMAVIATAMYKWFRHRRASAVARLLHRPPRLRAPPVARARGRAELKQAHAQRAAHAAHDRARQSATLRAMRTAARVMTTSKVVVIAMRETTPRKCPL